MPHYCFVGASGRVALYPSEIEIGRHGVAGIPARNPDRPIYIVFYGVRFDRCGYIGSRASLLRGLPASAICCAFREACLVGVVLLNDLEVRLVVADREVGFTVRRA